MRRGWLWLVGVLVSGCTLGEPSVAQKCPPKNGRADASVYYYDGDSKFKVNNGVCPENLPYCMDSLEADQSYYCMEFCNTACGGKCLEPDEFQKCKRQGLIDSQDNRRGAECDPDTFFIHCDMNRKVTCEEDEFDDDGKFKVNVENCVDPVLNIIRKCVENHDGVTGDITSLGCEEVEKCNQGEKIETCDLDSIGNEIRMDYECIKVKDEYDEKPYYSFEAVNSEGTYCSGVCSESCVEKECSFGDDYPKCNSKGNLLIDCVEVWKEDKNGDILTRGVVSVRDCRADEMICVVNDDGYADCVYDYDDE